MFDDVPPGRQHHSIDITKQKRKVARLALRRIGLHRRVKRLHIFSMCESEENDSSDIGYALLHSIVSSLELDAAMAREQKANRRSARPRVLREPWPWHDRICLTDDATTRYPPRCKPWEHEHFIGELREKYASRVLDFDFPTTKEAHDVLWRHTAWFQAHDMTWKAVDREQLSAMRSRGGNEIKSKALSTALRERRTFSQTEIEAFELQDLHIDNFIKVGEEYFARAAPDGFDFSFDYSPKQPMAELKEPSQQRSLGLRWRSQEPSGLLWCKVEDKEEQDRLLERSTHRLESPKLVAALEGRLERFDAPLIKFTLEEWRDFGVQGLRRHHYVMSSEGEYLQPAAELPKEGGQELWSAHARAGLLQSFEKVLDLLSDGHVDDAQETAEMTEAPDPPAVHRGRSRANRSPREQAWARVGVQELKRVEAADRDLVEVEFLPNVLPNNLSAELRVNDFIVVKKSVFTPLVPLNPKGRTGVQGRGLLASWGENRCIDCVITRKVNWFGLLWEKADEEAATGSNANELSTRFPALAKALTDGNLEFTEHELEDLLKQEDDSGHGAPSPAPLTSPYQLKPGDYLMIEPPVTAEESKRSPHRSSMGASNANSAIGPFYFRPLATKPRLEFLAERRWNFQCGIPGGMPSLGSSSYPDAKAFEDAKAFGWKLAALKKHLTDRLKGRLGQCEGALRKQCERVSRKQCERVSRKIHDFEALWSLMKERRELVGDEYVDDVRSTDNAWFKAAVYHMRLERQPDVPDNLGWPASDQPKCTCGACPADEFEVGWHPADEFEALPKQMTELQAGEEASGRTTSLLWLSMDRLSEPRFESVYAPHKAHLDKIIKKQFPHSPLLGGDPQSGNKYAKEAEEDGKETHADTIALEKTRHYPWHRLTLSRDGTHFESTDKKGYAVAYKPTLARIHDGPTWNEILDGPTWNEILDMKNELAFDDYNHLYKHGTFECVVVAPQDVKPEFSTDPREPSIKRFSSGDEQKKAILAHAPRNPWGTTGYIGCGLLKRWGVNKAADLVVTRVDPYSPNGEDFDVLVRMHKGSRMCRLPRKFFDDKDFDVGVDSFMRSSFFASVGEELLVLPHLPPGCLRSSSTSEDRSVTSRLAPHFARLVTELFSFPTELYKGYVDDPRNTDNAWIETICHGYRCNDELAKLLAFEVETKFIVASGECSTEAFPCTESGEDQWVTKWVSVSQVRQRHVQWWPSHRVLAPDAILTLIRRLESERLMLRGILDNVRQPGPARAQSPFDLAA